MAEIGMHKGVLVRLKASQEIGIVVATEGEKVIVFWGNGLCSEGLAEQVEAIPFSPQAGIPANFIELVDSFSLGRVWVKEGSPGSGRFA